MGVFDKRHAQRGIDTIRQLRRRAAHDALIRVAQPLAHIHRDVAQITLCQRTAQVVDAALAAYQRKEAAGCPHLRQNVVLPPVETHHPDILIGGPEPGAQIGQRAQTRQHRRVAALQQGQQLFRAAEEAGIAGHDHCEAAVLPVGADKVRNILRRNGVAGVLSRPRHSLQHPFCTDETVRRLNGFTDLTGHSLPAAGADADDPHLRPDGAAEPLTQHIQHRRKGKPLPLGRAANDHQTCARLPGGGCLSGKAAGFAAVLGHHPCGVGKPQCSQIHLLGERPLHGDDMGGLQPRCAAGLQRGIHGQHPGVYPLGKIGDAAIRRQFLTAGGQQDIAPRTLQKCGGRRRILHADHILRLFGGLPQQAQILRLRFPTGCADALGDGGGIGVGSVDDQIEPHPLQHPDDVLYRDASRQNRNVFRLRQQRFTVLRGHAYRSLHRLSGQEFHQLPALRGAGKHADITHCGILWV